MSFGDIYVASFTAPDTVLADLLNWQRPVVNLIKLITYLATVTYDGTVGQEIIINSVH